LQEGILLSRDKKKRLNFRRSYTAVCFLFSTRVIYFALFSCSDTLLLLFNAIAAKIPI
jgi:hypothetical protein